MIYHVGILDGEIAYYVLNSRAATTCVSSEFDCCFVINLVAVTSIARQYAFTWSSVFYTPSSKWLVQQPMRGRRCTILLRCGYSAHRSGTCGYIVGAADHETCSMYVHFSLAGIFCSHASPHVHCSSSYFVFWVFFNDIYMLISKGVDFEAVGFILLRPVVVYVYVL